MATNKRLIKSNDEGGAVGASFNTVLWTGNGTARSITGVGFQPNMVWLKSRTLTTSHFIVDSIRGANEVIFPNLTNAETFTSVDITSLDADGFSLSTGVSVNQSGQGYVAWNFKAGGYTNTFNVLENGSTTSSATAGGAGITAGSLTNGWSVSANRDAGFSVVSYSKAIGSSAATIGHGLNNDPKMIIVKARDAAEDWRVYHTGIGSTKYLSLNLTSQALTSSVWNNTDPTTSVFSLGTFSSVGNGNMIAYCFAEVAGFSKFGSYAGTSVSGTPFIDCGFEPAFVMIRVTTRPGIWLMYDNKRDTTNPNGTSLQAQNSNPDLINDGFALNFLPTGFNINSTDNQMNATGDTYIYMAFAN
jgi:hypothetical protein